MRGYLEEAIGLSERRTEQRRMIVRAALSSDSPTPILGGSGNALDFGRESEHTEQLTHFRGTTHTVISRIATVLAGQPMYVGRIVREPSRPSRSQKSAQDTQVETLPDHELLDILADPNPAMPIWGHVYATICSLEINGIAYWWFDSSGDGTTVWALPGSWVTPKHSRTEMYVGYEIRSSWESQGKIVPPEEIVPFSLPDPANPLKYVSPLQAHAPEVALDEQLVISQHRSFKNAANPSLAMRVGRLPGMQPGMPGERPVLTRSQRADIIEAVRALWAGAVNYNEPLIIDGLIEGIDKLNMTPREMDFIRSGDAVQSRIAKAYGCNPIILGEIVGANRAQAAVAEQVFDQMVINPLAELMGQCVTRWARQHYGDDLVFWIEPARPHDAEQKLREWDVGLQRSCVAPNEYRANILGLPPLEDEAADRPIPQPGGFLSGRPQAKAVKVPGPNESVGGRLSFRKLVEFLWLRQLEDREHDMVEAMGRYFRAQAAEIRGEARRLAAEAPELFGDAGSAATLAAMLYRPREWDVRLRAAAFKPLVRSVLSGYLAERALFESRHGKQGQRELTAEELQILEFEIPESVREQVRVQVQQQMAQEYWEATNDYTLRVVESSVRNGVLEGMSPGKIASAIYEAASDVDRVRSKRIARTEIRGALNAGHQVQAGELQGQGYQVVKTWVTVGDRDVRPSHVEMEGQTVEGSDGEFNVSGYLAPFPGHFSLPPAESVNCRCSFYTDIREGGEA